MRMAFPTDHCVGVLTLAGLILPLAACGGSGPDAESPQIQRPRQVDVLALPEQCYAVPGQGLGGLSVAHSATLGHLIGGSGGLFTATSEGVERLDPDPVTAMAVHEPEGVLISSASGLALYSGGLATSPLSEALGDRSVVSVAERAGELWLGTSDGLLQWREGELYRFDDMQSVLHISTFSNSSRVLVTTSLGLYLLSETKDGWVQVDLQAEFPVETAFTLADGTVLGIKAGALYRRVSQAEGISWRPQAVDPEGPALTSIDAVGQDPERGAVWVAAADKVYRLDGPQVAVQARPEGLGTITQLAVDELGALWLTDDRELMRLGTEAAPVTWQSAVSKFSADNCERCHAPLGNAHPLDTFEAWSLEAGAIIGALENMTMPQDKAPLIGGSADTIRRWQEDGLLY